MATASVASAVDESLYPVAVLIDELRHDDIQNRLKSIRHLDTIAVALGPERTRDELVPFLQEIVDDDDDVLIALCEQLGAGVPWVGGAPHAHTLIGPLEELCSVEEPSVRDKATEALRGLIAQMSADQVVRHVCALIKRLSEHEWPASRISGCNLFAVVLPKVPETKQDDLLKLFCRLCADETPMVRRQAGNVLGAIALVLVKDSMFVELFEVFEKLARDEQDSVRILAITNCIALGKLNATKHSQICTIVKACAEDKSWRVRYMVADHIKELCAVFSNPSSQEVERLFLKMFSDAEVEVRTIAAARICAVAAANQSREFLEDLLHAVEKLVQAKEQSHHVRASLAGSFLKLAPIVGLELTVQKLVSIVLSLIKDKSPEVRLRLIGTLGDLSDVVELKELSKSLLPSIKELGNDHQWRVRLALLESMPALAKYLGEAQFTEEMRSLFMPWLTDPVFSVRAASSETFRRLQQELGAQWSEDNIIPQLSTLLTHKNYLYRISAMLCAKQLAEVSDEAFIKRHLVPMVVQLCEDPVPNVRFNVTKTIQAMHKACPGVSPSTLDCLRQLHREEDPDVKFFAQKAMSDMGEVA